MRRGITIIEVLFAVMITTVGLFGAIAIFPVAANMAKRARTNDMLAAAGRSMFHRFDTMGMRRPDRWLAWDQANQRFTDVAVGGGTIPANLQIVEALCIDPRMIAAHTQLNGAGNQFLPANSQCIQTFPYTEPYQDTNRDSIWVAGETFNDLNGNGAHDPYQAGPYRQNDNGVGFDTSLMRRITLWSGVTNASGQKMAMGLPQANHVFLIDDDLSYDRPREDKSRPASQYTTTLPFGPVNPQGVADAWGKRQTDGNLSWIATLVAVYTVNADAPPASRSPSDEYVLSVVMRHGHPNDLDNLDANKERTVYGVFQDTVTATGGEIYLTASSPEQLKLRANEWVMVSGTQNPLLQPDGVTLIPPKPFTRFQWYRISDCDREPTENLANPAHQRWELYATLMGQDWSAGLTSPMPTGSVPPGAGLSYSRVTIVEGAYAVYEKTVRLEYGSTF